MLQFLAGGVVVALVLGIGSALLLRDAARAEAERSARRSTELTARAVVEPALTTGVLRREPAAVERFDQLVRARIMDATTVRVKLWSADGTVVYSDQSQLLGRTFGLDGEEREVIRDGGTVSEVTDLDRPENRADRGFDRLLEVYTRVEAADGTPLLYETYVRDEAVSRSGRALWGRILPTAVGALLLLELVQVPLALRLARRFGDRRRERERLLQAAVDSSELERRRIARDLHDGVVQHLAGVGLHLHAASVDPTVDAAGAAELMGSSAADVRQAIRELRTLLVDIYPPNLRELGLTQALEDLVSELPARGIKPRLEVQDVEHLEPRIEQLLYRVAQEAVRNAERHSGATQVTLEVGGRGPAIGLCVTDDGAGFDTTRAPADGHVGLLLLRDLVAASGGRLHVRSTPGNGTVVDLELDTDRA
ncbi:MAG: hypothetical protein JWM86_2332 [Thermoleophilia bacterium]|nr:hypothetical protein [Thermoleophilia bacterium]